MTSAAIDRNIRRSQFQQVRVRQVTMFRSSTDSIRRFRRKSLVWGLTLVMAAAGHLDERSALAGEHTNPLLAILREETKANLPLANAVFDEKLGILQPGTDAVAASLELLASIRYIRSHAEPGGEPFSDKSTESVPQLLQCLNEALRRSGLPEIECGANEFRSIVAGLLPRSYANDLVNPYFREPVSALRIAEICGEIQAAVDELSPSRRFYLGFQPEITEPQRKWISERYRLQLVRDGIAAPLMRDTRLAIEAEMQRIVDHYGLADQDAVRPLPEKTDIPPRDDTSEFGSLNESFERLYGTVFSFLPLLLLQEEGGASHRTTIDVEIELLRAPGSKLRTSVASSVDQGWWLILFDHFESSDGRYFGEDRLSGVCLAFDRVERRLYLYEPSTHELKPVCESGQNPVVKGFYLLSGYRFSDVWGAMNTAESLARYVKTKDFPNLETGRNREALDGMLGRSGLTASGIVLSRSEAQIPRIVIPFGLSSSQSLADASYLLPAQIVLFPNGATLDLAFQAEQSRFTAPHRLRVLSRKRDIRGGRSMDRDSKRVSIATIAKDLLYGCTTYRMREVARCAATCANAGEVESSLESLRQLSMVSGHSQSVSLCLNDLMIGHLLALSRTAEAMDLLHAQVLLLQTHPDRDYPAEYFGYYAKRLGQDSISGDRFRVHCFFLPHDPQTVPTPELRPVPDLPAGLFNGASGTRRDPALEATQDIGVRLHDSLSSISEASLRIYLERMLTEALADSPEIRFVDIETADEIEDLWNRGIANLVETRDSNRQMIHSVTLVWQVYHRCLAYWEPISRQFEQQKKGQLASLNAVIDRLSEQVQGWDFIDKSGRDALTAECLRSQLRLAEYSSSPFYPFLYYPLNEAAFRSALASVESRVVQDAESLHSKLIQARLDGIHGEVQKLGRNVDLDLFQTKARTSAALHLPTLASLTLGNIIRQYGIVERRIDYRDRRMFPIGSTRGLSVVYQMQGGIFTEVHVEWALGDRVPELTKSAE